ncbi:GSCFA domain-containing protein [Aestuariivivens sp. NBU2969]|uniref:GSCFA domain-containing protein n=1 Tax=Aestuariivivens sp. NBU2969 TaxID=2873267 RepID=UPI001CBF5DD1|nr:GSCFA domain-containing protein [Aestuariivivens sp. NBU2969]
MNLQTNIILRKQPNNLIDYNSNVLLLGSCFVEHIGGKLSYFKFKTLQNPFGILFHPKAIETLVAKSVVKSQYTEKDIFYHNERWHCFDAHSRLSHTSKEVLLGDLNNSISATTKQLRSTSHIIITLGTAWVYRFLQTSTIVANCHKIPQKQFKKELLSIETITSSLHYLTDLIKAINPEVTFIFTASPVRHLKDGFIENTQSKAHLIAAIHQFLNQKSSIANRQLFYFPSYEIMMDELRDYRFYAEDMIHPNTTAVNYIWKKFQSVWFAPQASKTMEQVDAVQKGLLHKPFNPDSKAYKEFMQHIDKQIAKLKLQFPHIMF